MNASAPSSRCGANASGQARSALIRLLAQAQSDGLLGSGDPALMAEQFFALLWGDLRLQVLLHLAAPPRPAEIKRRTQAATEALLVLYARKATIR